MALQLRDRLTRGLSLARPLPATLMFDYPTIDALATRLLALMRPAAAAEHQAAPAVALAPSLAAHELAHLSDADIERLLASREVSRA
jgi:hypothetical protein